MIFYLWPLTKTEFHVQETTFLGLIITIKGVKMDPKKVNAILAWPEPKTVKQVQLFLGFCNFYKRFIQGYASIANPLTQLIKKNKVFT